MAKGKEIKRIETDMGEVLRAARKRKKCEQQVIDDFVKRHPEEAHRILSLKEFYEGIQNIAKRNGGALGGFSFIEKKNEVQPVTIEIEEFETEEKLSEITLGKRSEGGSKTGYTRRTQENIGKRSESNGKNE